ncbi:MAG: PAS-domain containing protein, partial [Rhodospirillales bacterium]|nr:PAS-domain containing protein [Rhodospirillales bacterium]
MGPWLSFFLGAALIAAVAAPLLIVLRRRAHQAGREYEQSRADAETAREILETVPDGYLLLDIGTGTAICSRRLAILLGLASGTSSGFNDVLARFEDQSANCLRVHTDQLARDGQGFSLILPVVGNGRTLQIIGIRAIGSSGTPTADVLWFRDLNGASHPQQENPSGNPLSSDPEILRDVLQALPFPAQLLGPDGQLAFANSASNNVTATADISPPENGHEVEIQGGSKVRLSIPDDLLSAQNESAQSASVWFRVLETVSTAISVFDSRARLQFANSAYAGLWHLDSAWLETGPRLGDILDRLREERRLPEVADYAAFRDEQVTEAKASGPPAESMMHLPDGRTLRRVVAPNPGGGIVIAFDDLSERLSLERSLNELNAVQRETLDNLFEGIAAFAADGSLRLSNPAFAQLWGFADDDMQAMHVSRFAEALQASLIASRVSGPASLMTAARLMSRTVQSGRFERQDGKIVEFATVPLPDGAVLISFLDVTDSARVEQALRQRAEALDAANRLKSEFIANVSYEIRTPLTTLMGFAEILTDQYFGGLNRRQMEYSRGILDSSRNLMSVVNDILDLAG